MLQKNYNFYLLEKQEFILIKDIENKASGNVAVFFKMFIKLKCDYISFPSPMNTKTINHKIN